MSGTTKTTCPTCGATLENAGQDAMCPACLLSGALAGEPHADHVDPEGETQQVPPRASGSAPQAASFDLPRDLGDYTLTSVLGRGGMGTVYEALQRSTGRRLALKVLAQNLDTPEMRQRFLREGRLAARVNHPSSLYVFGSEDIDGVPIITMEIAPGGTLQDALNRRGPLPVTEAVDAVLSMIDGLEAALERGVLHRDIKPSNCFLAPDGTVKVGDFGLSVSTLPSADSFMTQTGKVMGTPAFASPQQLRGDEVDARSDIYSVGATLYTLLTAKAPFEGENAVQVVANVIDTPAPNAASVRDDLPVALSKAISRCLAKEPTDRYPDYAALRNALLPFGSAIPEPATQSQRGAAGWIDYLMALLPTYAALMIIVGPEKLFIRPFYELTFSAWKYHLLIFAMGALYFAVTEGVWGAGLGKWIMNLRVINTKGRAPGPALAALRFAVPIAVIEAVRVPLSISVVPSGAWGVWHSVLIISFATFCPWVVAVLWLTARRENGFATVWDLATGTRVVVRPRGARRPSAIHATDHDDSRDQSAMVGPVQITSTIEPDRWLGAYDPVLRRNAWMIRRDTAEVSEARRAIARPGRPRWLQEVHDENQVWDVYEASRGATLLKRLSDGPIPWSIARYWLHDIAAEVRAAERDGTLAAEYSLDQIWITDDGRVMLLDRPWPNSDRPAEAMPVKTIEEQQRFLQRVADFIEPLSVPLHARPALDNLRSGSFEKLTYLAGTLQGLLNKPAEVSRGLRAASLFVIPGYTTVATFLGIAANLDPAVGVGIWIGRFFIASLAMMVMLSGFDFVLAFWKKSTGLSTFGLEAVTRDGRASRTRLMIRSSIMWIPVLTPTAILAAPALSQGEWIRFNAGATLGAITLAGALVFVISALLTPTRGLHDRIAGVWIVRR